MLYLRNSDLVASHRVALNTVLNWIKAAEQGKLDLELVRKGDRSYIANTAKNVQKIEHLVDERKKYRNTRTAREVTPTDEFYETYNEQQILDIVRSLDIYHELPRQYNYFGEGAHYWDAYTQKLAHENAPNLFNSTLKLLDANKCYFDYILSKYDRVNIVDIGAGNAMPVKGLLERLFEQGMLGRYIAIDISHEMLQIARHNIEEWFDGRIPFEGYELDISRDRFNHILASESLGEGATKTVNIVTVFGGTFHNLKSLTDPLKIVRDSLSRNDLMIYAVKLNTDRTRRFFDFNSTPPGSALPSNHRMMFDLMGIDPSFYEAEMGYDQANKMRYVRARLVVSLKFRFRIGDKERTVELDKGEAILLWRAWDVTAKEILNYFGEANLYPLLASQTEDKDYLLAISRIDPILSS